MKQDMESFRDAYLRRRRQTAEQRRIHIAQSRRSVRRTDKLVELSRKGESLADAAIIVGVVESTARKLLRNRFGTSKWPVDSPSLPAPEPKPDYKPDPVPAIDFDAIVKRLEAWDRHIDATNRRAPRELGYRGVQVLAFVRATIAETGQAPSYLEIMKALDFYDRSKVCKVVERLEKRGLLSRVGHGRVRRIRLPA